MFVWGLSFYTCVEPEKAPAGSGHDATARDGSRPGFDEASDQVDRMDSAEDRLGRIVLEKNCRTDQEQGCYERGSWHRY